MAGIGVAMGLAAIVATSPTTASLTELRAFDAAMAAHRYRAAADAYDRAIDARIAARQTGDDPAITEMAARIAMRGGASAQTLAMLQQAAIRAAPERQAALLLAQGRVEESLGRLVNAEKSYRQAAATGGPEVVGAARLALARRLLDHDPAGAAALLEPLESGADPDLRWGATMLRSRARALAGDDAGALADIAAAWTLAIATSNPAGAAQRVARDRAIGAPRQEQVALAAFRPIAGGQVGGIVPPACGGTLRPDDMAIVEIARRNDGQIEFGVVRASRPEVANAFVAAVADSAVPGKDAVATVQLRCRHSVRDTGPRAIDQETAITGWVVARGLYIRQMVQADDVEDAIAQQRRHLAALRAAYGADTLEAFGTLVLLSALDRGLAATSGNPVYLSHSRADLEEATRLARSDGAPVLGIAALEENAAAIPEDTAMTPTQRGERYATLLRKDIDRVDVPTDALMGPLLGATRNRQLPLTDRIAAVDRIRAILAARRIGAADPRAQAATARRLALLQEDGTGGAAALAKAAAFDPGLCQANDVPPRILNTDAIAAEDYPEDLTIAAVQGVMTIEYDVDQSGKPARPRVVLASPPELFDSATAAGFAKFRFEAARSGGKPFACRAAQQTIRWALPDEDGELERLRMRAPVG